jgi:hypothetical protein
MLILDNCAFYVSRTALRFFCCEPDTLVLRFLCCALVRKYLLPYMTLFEVHFSQVQHLMGKLIQYAPIDAAVDQLGKKLMLDALPPALEEAEKCRTVHSDGERYVTTSLE